MRLLEKYSAVAGELVGELKGKVAWYVDVWGNLSRDEIKKIAKEVGVDKKEFEIVMEILASRLNNYVELAKSQLEAWGIAGREYEKIIERVTELEESLKKVPSPVAYKALRYLMTGIEVNEKKLEKMAESYVRSKIYPSRWQKVKKALKYAGKAVFAAAVVSLIATRVFKPVYAGNPHNGEKLPYKVLNIEKGDFNGDGHTDIKLTVTDGNKTYDIFISNASKEVIEKFTSIEPGTTVYLGIEERNEEWYDFDGDKKIDRVISTDDEYSVTYYVKAGDALVPITYYYPDDEKIKVSVGDEYLSEQDKSDFVVIQENYTYKTRPPIHGKDYLTEDEKSTLAKATLIGLGTAGGVAGVAWLAKRIKKSSKKDITGRFNSLSLLP